MKKRNKYWEKDKEYRRILNALYENQTAQRNLGYVELDQPRPKGYTAHFVLRDDIARRDDAWVFQKIIDLCGSTAWSRKDDFARNVKIHNDKIFAARHSNLTWYQYPQFSGLSDYEFHNLNLPEQVKKYFTEVIDKWNRRWYSVNVPYFYFEVKSERYYITKVKIIDEVLLQEEAELESKLYSYSDRRYNYCHGTASKSYVRSFNISHRRQEKQKIHQFIYNKKQDIIFPGRHRHDAEWSYW